MPTLQESLEVLPTIEAASFIFNGQSAHRVEIFQSWLRIAQENDYNIESNITGKQILDIGCGQGDMIEVVAALLKAQGNKESSVIGVDPASLDYGSPWTLGEAQSSLSASPLGEYLRFKQTTAPALVASQPIGTYSAAYFAHSLYYLPSSATLVQTFKSLLDSAVKTLLLAEWSLSISKPAALPHLLAVLLQSIDPLPDGNVRTVLSPAAYADAATKAGWDIMGSTTLTPVAELKDGNWEAGFARSVARKSELGKQALQVSGERSIESIRSASLRAHADALEASITAEVGLDGVQCMDVWTAVFRARPSPSGEPRPTH